MRRLAGIPAFLAAACLLAQADAQPPEQEKAKKEKDYSNATIVVRMMAFNKKNDGKLTREEVTDPRLRRLFDLADANKDGVVTREELMNLAALIDVDTGPGEKKGPGGFEGKRKKGPPPDGPDGYGPPPKKGRKGPPKDGADDPDWKDGKKGPPDDPEGKGPPFRKGPPKKGPPDDPEGKGPPDAEIETLPPPRERR